MKLSELFGIKHHELNLEELYSMTKYGKILTEEEITEDLIRSIDEKIRSAAESGRYAIIIDYGSDYVTYFEKIKSHYEELDLTVKIVDIETKTITAEFIVITWIK